MKKAPSFMQSLLMRSFIFLMALSLIVACSPPEDNSDSSESVSESSATSLGDVSSLDEKDGATARLSAVPDIVFVEGFSNFLHDAAADDGPLQTVLNVFVDLFSGAPASTDGRLAFAQFYWKQFYNEGFASNDGLFGVFGDNNLDKIGQVAYLHWDSGNRIGRSSNPNYRSQLYDNYDAAGSKGLITRFNELLDGNHNQPQAVGYQFCQNGCIVITHSTGGTVADVLLAETNPSNADGYTGASDQSIQGLVQGQASDADINAKKARVWNNVTVAMEIASANGGTGLADWIIDDIANNAFCDSTAFIVRMLFTDFECANGTATMAGQVINTDPNNPDINGSEGAGYDLTLITARAATGPYGAHRSNLGGTPVLMVAGNGTIIDLDAWPFTETSGLITSHLTGTNDGLISMHSACASQSFGDYESCHPSVNADGYTHENGYSAPSSLFTNHYGFIMTQEGHLSQTMPGVRIDVVNLLDTMNEVLVPNSNWANQWQDSGLIATDYEVEEVANANSNKYGGSFYTEVVSREDQCANWYCGHMESRVDRMLLKDDGLHLSRIIGDNFDTQHHDTNATRNP